MDEFYIDVVLNLLYDIRLRIEGAVELYENDAAPLHRLAVETNMPTVAGAFDTIGSALYHLRQDIRSLHEAYTKESIKASK